MFMATLLAKGFGSELSGLSIHEIKQKMSSLSNTKRGNYARNCPASEEGQWQQLCDLLKGHGVYYDISEGIERMNDYRMITAYACNDDAMCEITPKCRHCLEQDCMVERPPGSSYSAGYCMQEKLMLGCARLAYFKEAPCICNSETFPGCGEGKLAEEKLEKSDESEFLMKLLEKLGV